MIKYAEIRPKVYVETTVVSYLVARPSNNITLAARQRATRQLWDDYSNNFEFVVSDIVITEIRQGNETAAQRRIDALAGLTVLNLSPEAVCACPKSNHFWGCSKGIANRCSTYCCCRGVWHRVPNLMELQTYCKRD